MAWLRTTGWPSLAGITFVVGLFATGTDLATIVASLTMVAAVTVVSVFASSTQVSATRFAGCARSASRDKEHRAIFLPQCDPDASGRQRPRAPGNHRHR